MNEELKLISSRLSVLFENKINVQVLPRIHLTKDKLKNIDFLVSTFKIENIQKPYILVKAMLSKENIKEISNEINIYFFKEKLNQDEAYENIDLFDQLDKIVKINDEISSIINNFNIHYID